MRKQFKRFEFEWTSRRRFQNDFKILIFNNLCDTTFNEKFLRNFKHVFFVCIDEKKFEIDINNQKTSMIMNFFCGFFFSFEFFTIDFENVCFNAENVFRRCRIWYFWKLFENDVFLNLNEGDSQIFWKNVVISNLIREFKRAWSQESNLKCIKSFVSSTII